MNVTMTSAYVLGNFYDALVTADNDGNLHPALALSWEMRDPTTWVFQLRPNITFSDGEPWTAAAAKATFDFLKSEAAAGATFGRDMRRIVEVTAEGTLTLVIKTEAPNIVLPQHLLFLYFASPKNIGHDWLAKLSAAPVGTGSFVVQTWGPERMVLSPRTDGWRPPLVDGLEIRAIPEATSREQALTSGRVDVALALNPDQIETLEAAGHRVHQRRPTRIATIVLDTVSPQSPFRDVRLRQAVNYAVNREAISASLLGGLVAPASQPAIETALGYDPALQPYPYDPAKARALLAEAGKPNGFKFIYEFAPGTVPNDAAIMQQIATDLAKVGIVMEIRSLPFPQFARNVAAGGWTGAAWSMDYPGYFHDALKPFYGSIHSCEWAAPWFCEPETEKRVKAAAESVDRGQRVRLTQELMRYYRDIAQSLFLYPALGLDGLGPRIKTWQPWGDNLMLHTVTVGAP